MPNLPWSHRTTASITLVSSCLGATIVNVHHIEATTVQETNITDDDDAVGEVATCVADWITSCKAAYLNAHGGEFTLLRVVGQVLERPGTFRHRLTPTETVPSAPVVGDPTLGAIEVLTTSGVIKWKTPIAGKSHRGRTYFGPLGLNQVQDGRLSTSGSTNLTNYTNSLMGLWGPAGSKAAAWRLTIYSRPYNMGEYQYATRKTGSLTVVTPPDYAGNSTNVTSASVDATLRVQRRRELGVGT